MFFLKGWCISNACPCLCSIWCSFSQFRQHLQLDLSPVLRHFQGSFTPLYFRSSMRRNRCLVLFPPKEMLKELIWLFIPSKLHKTLYKYKSHTNVLRSTFDRKWFRAQAHHAIIRNNANIAIYSRNVFYFLLFGSAAIISNQQHTHTLLENNNHNKTYSSQIICIFLLKS